MPTIISNEYLTVLDVESIKSLNSFFANSTDGNIALLVRNSTDENQISSYNNKHIYLKSNVKLDVNKQKIGSFHILTCISSDQKIKSDFQRICNYIFIEKNESKNSDEVITLFYSLQNIFSEEIIRENHFLQIGLYGEYVALLKLIDSKKKNIFEKWHTNFSTRHDIEIDGQTRIEIKTTAKSERIHRFNHEQISRKNLKVFVISNVIELSETGTSLYDLSLKMMSLFSDHKKKLSIEQLINRCGISEFNKGVTSNLEDCFQKCKLYEDIDVPKLIINDHSAITNISYDIDFSMIKEIDFEMLP